MAVSLVALKLLFSVLTCVMAAALTYGLLMDGFSSCIDPRASLPSTFKKKVGDGSRTKFWHDEWLGGLNLKETFLKLFRFETHQSCLIRPICSEEEFTEFAGLCNLVSHLRLTSIEDKWECTTSHSRIFTIAKETWKSIGNWWKITNVDITNLQEAITFAKKAPISATNKQWFNQLFGIYGDFGMTSVVICGHIVMLLFMLTPEESSKDPIYFVLARRQKWDDMGYKRAPSVVTARVIVAALGCLMIGASIYAFFGDGSPFHMEVLTP
ncbi:reverse transcriptase, RNA-dependent DNA polymerase [Tanacetum coccineum]